MAAANMETLMVLPNLSKIIIVKTKNIKTV